MNTKQLAAVIENNLHKFCEVVGDGSCGCSACPYFEYNVNEDGGCYEEYVKSTMEAMEKLPDEEEADVEWISCNEELPEIGKSVLVTIVCPNGKRMCAIAERLPNKWMGIFGMEVIAWMPLPEPYKKIIVKGEF